MSADKDSIKRAASGQWREILAESGGVPREHLDGKNHPCPKCGGADRFRMLSADRGALFCNQCFSEKNGDGLSALQWLNSWSFSETLEHLARRLGMGSANGKLGREVAAYPYHDETGKLLFEVVRFDPKDFRQRAPDGTWKTKGIRKVPFHLPQLLVEPRRAVFIVEGEKDVLSLEALGFVATTNPGGAGKWALIDVATVTAALEGCDLIIPPDNDETGRKHGLDVARHVFPIAKSVRILTFPGLSEKGDVSDWIAAGGTRAELEAIVKATKPIEAFDLESEPEPGSGPAEAREGDGAGRPEGEAEEEGDIALALYEPPPIEVLPEVLRDFIQEEARALGVDDAYMVLPSLATVAGAIGLSARVQLSPEWREPGLLWTALIAESGARKSPPFGHALEALWRLDDAERPGYQAAMKAFQQKLEDYSNSSKKDRLSMEKPEPPLEPRVTASDITFEALIEVLSQHPRGILAHYDELGAWFASFDAYRGGKGGDAAKWRTMYDGGRVDCRRKNGTNIVLPRAGVAVTGAIQPGALRALMMDRDGCPSPMVTGGTIGRFLLAAPPPAYAPAPRNGAVSQDTRGRHFQAIRELALVQMGEDQHGNPSFDLLHLTPEAADRWYEFLKAWAETKRDTESSALKSAASKCEGRAARIALDLHCYDRAVEGHVSHGQADWGRIPLRWIEAGIQLSCEWGWREAQRWYGAPDGLRVHQRPLVVWVSQRGGKATVRDLTRSGPRKYRGKIDAGRKAFQELVDLELGRWNLSAGSRAPSELFELNPNRGSGTGDRFHVPPQEYEESVSSSRRPDPETAEGPSRAPGEDGPDESSEVVA